MHSETPANRDSETPANRELIEIILKFMIEKYKQARPGQWILPQTEGNDDHAQFYNFLNGTAVDKIEADRQSGAKEEDAANTATATTEGAAVAAESTTTHSF